MEKELNANGLRLRKGQVGSKGKETKHQRTLPVKGAGGDDGKRTKRQRILPVKGAGDFRLSGTVVLYEKDRRVPGVCTFASCLQTGAF